MKIASLDPYITELIAALGAHEGLCGVSSGAELRKSGLELPLLMRPFGAGESFGAAGLASRLGNGVVDLKLLKEVSPELILSSFPAAVAGPDFDFQGAEDSASLELSELIGHGVRFRLFNPQTLEALLEGFEKLGMEAGCAARGRELTQRARAQLMDWSDNFYDRTHNKKVTFLSSVEPFCLGAFWIPDLIRLACAIPQQAGGDGKVDFAAIQTFRPDVLIVAPQGKTLEESARLFRFLETVPGFEDLPAARRGEVFFVDGIEHFYQPTLQVIDSAAILISAIAGMDSGYITRRDSFYRLRWLELQRHRFT